MARDVQIDVRSAMIAATSRMESQAAVGQAMTSEEWSTGTSLKNTRRTQFLDLLFVQLCHNRPVFQSAGHKQLSSSIELDAQNV